MINTLHKISMMSRKITGESPKITGVYLSYSSPAAIARIPWQSAFLNNIQNASLGSNIFGYKIPVGIITTASSRHLITPGQLDPYIWPLLNTLYITFDQDVNITSGSLTINGISSTYNIFSFSYGLVGSDYAAKWQFTQSPNAGFSSVGDPGNLVIPDKIRLILDADLITGVAGGIKLAGEITNATWTSSGDATTASGSELPSGGEPGTDFNLRLNLLAADYTVNAITNSADLFGLRAAGYNIWKDLDGDGTLTYALTTDSDRALSNTYLARALPNGVI
jgi:hypothetical protein